ncbi:hypothetical protein [Aeromonas media]|uniref:phage head spike fiber domain-containing protein n=1 Tax=Aeromonas media TaxID=651 RepID=UPI00384AC389
MAGVWKRDGTVAVTNGNKKVTGTGTTFADTKNGVAKGHLFCITSGTSVDFYEVDYVVSNTELYLVQAYRGVTATGKAYEIITTFSDSVPEFARRLTATLSAYQQQSDAFQALLTSNAATIEVPAPDGTKQTLIPWKRVTSDGEGQAARAKVEADKATAAANLAVNVVRDAALPLPDVWAPLSDSLRLITGYGREVKVGDDVVGQSATIARASAAWYVDKSGTLRQAAINEPRFEREGLLIEGPGTNFLEWSDVATWRTQTGVVVTPGQTSPDGGNSAVKLAKSANNTDSNVRDANFSIAAGEAITVSVYAKAGELKNIELACDYLGVWGGVTQPRLRVDLNTGQVALSAGFTAYQITSLANGWFRLSATVVASSAGVTRVVIGIYDDAWSTNGDGVKGLFVFGAQAEKFPIVTSYIPTNGAAATRAAEYPQLPIDRNIPNKPFTLSYQLNVPWLGAEAPNASPRAISITGGVVGSSIENSIYPSGSFSAGGGVSGASSSVAGFVNQTIAGCVVTGAGLNAFTGGGKAVGTQGVNRPYGPTICLGGKLTGADRHLYGHIRDLKIWHFEAADAQLKALR